MGLFVAEESASYAWAALLTTERSADLDGTSFALEG